MWRRLHWFTYALFGLATFHGVAAGTDTARPWMLATLPRRAQALSQPRRPGVRSSLPPAGRSRKENSHEQVLHRDRPVLSAAASARASTSPRISSGSRPEAWRQPSCDRPTIRLRSMPRTRVRWARSSSPRRWRHERHRARSPAPGSPAPAAPRSLRAFGWQGRVLLAGDELQPPYERPALSKELLTGGRTVSLRARSSSGRSTRSNCGSGAASTDIDHRLRTARVGRRDRRVGRVGHRDRRKRAQARRTARSPSPAVARRTHSAFAQTCAPTRRVVIVGAGFIGGEVASTHLWHGRLGDRRSSRRDAARAGARRRGRVAARLAVSRTRRRPAARQRVWTASAARPACVRSA